jgi:hypothetical protein
MKPGREDNRSLSARLAPVYGALIAGLIGMALLHSCNQEREPGAVANIFVEAFVQADTDRAKSVTVRAQWDRIDDWMTGRRPFKCRGSSLVDNTGIDGVGTLLAASNEWRFSLGYQCASERTPYCLDVNDMLIRETEDGWRIIDWGAVCEADDSSYRCAELCR